MLADFILIIYLFCSHKLQLFHVFRLS